jgi:isocitrate dehydrogenase (NAD+)
MGARESGLVYRLRVVEPTTIIVMEGDQTGQELLVEALRVLDPGVSGLPLTFEHYDLSLESRRRTGNQVVHDAAQAMRRAGFGLKAATITPEASGDVGSPNALLREEIDGRVIIRTGRRLPGVRPIGGIHAPISVVRMAVDDAYGAVEHREGTGLDEVAWRTEHISRRTCRAVAEFSFLQARRMNATVYGGPKWTVSPVYEGMMKEELDFASDRHRDVRYRPVLIDAAYAGLITHTGDALVVPALNRDGDCLSDMVLQLFGSIAGAESLLLAFDDDLNAKTVMADAPHGTAPGLEGKSIANPLAMILAGAALLGFVGDPAASMVSRGIYEAALEAVADDIRTADLSGHSSTEEFTAEVIKRLRTKLDVWSSLGDSAVI